MTEICLLRSDSKGLPGSIENAKHHAQAILPYIRAMREAVKHLGFAKWRQGNNVHEFITVEGTRYTLRAFTEDGRFGREYVGIRLALRVSRSKEIRLIDIDEVSDVPRLLDAMKLLAVPQIGNDSGVMCSKEAA